MHEKQEEGKLEDLAELLDDAFVSKLQDTAAFSGVRFTTGEDLIDEKRLERRMESLVSSRVINIDFKGVQKRSREEDAQVKIVHVCLDVEFLSKHSALSLARRAPTETEDADETTSEKGREKEEEGAEVKARTRTKNASEDQGSQTSKTPASPSSPSDAKVKIDQTRLSVWRFSSKLMEFTISNSNWGEMNPQVQESPSWKIIDLLSSSTAERVQLENKGGNGDGSL